VNETEQAWFKLPVRHVDEAESWSSPEIAIQIGAVESHPQFVETSSARS